MEEPKQNFVEVAKERYNSEPSPWWTKVGYIAGPIAGGISFVMTIEGIPKWLKYALGFLIGMATWFVPAKFGTTSKRIADK
jgi:hypothetical protein